MNNKTNEWNGGGCCGVLYAHSYNIMKQPFGKLERIVRMVNPEERSRWRRWEQVRREVVNSNRDVYYCDCERTKVV